MPESQSHARQAISEIDVLWINAGLGCDGDTIAMTAATQPSIEDIVLGSMPWIPKVHFHNPFLAIENGDDFLSHFHLAAEGKLSPSFWWSKARFRTRTTKEGYWASMGTDPKTGQPITTCQWIDWLAPRAWAVVAAGTCSTYGGIHAMEGNPTGCMGLPDYLGWDWKSTAQIPIVCANRSSEPIAYQDDDALTRLAGIADAFLIGQRPIARRVDDSAARAGAFGPVVLRRSRGYAPGAVPAIPSDRPILAVGADLKNAITLVVDGQAFVSQHIGDLEHYSSLRAFRETIGDLISMYEVRSNELLVVHDSHPQYASTAHALALDVPQRLAVQHHRAHIASVLAERGEWEKQVAGVSFDGTGYGDDGSIWGGEIFVGSVKAGFERVAHLRAASLPGGDAAAQYPVQAAAGFLAQLDGLPDLSRPPFEFPERYRNALGLIGKNLRTFRTSSVGRLFDAAAALLGFTRDVTFEGQAAMWLERLARCAPATEAYPFPYTEEELARAVTTV